MILLVEDDYLVRELLRSFLESAGYQVIEAASAEEALRAVGARALDVRLMVTDMDLPGLDGAELARRLRTARPDLKILYVSGHPVEQTAGASAQASIDSLSKPFTREMLLEKIRRLLIVRA